ncbi:MAG: recombinase family protein [Campylobacterales bacterium]|nr:recombinase family protein [Campylobacterales bacterium]
MIYAYFRQITNYIGLSEQQQMILSFSLKRQMDIDKEVVEYSAKNLPIEKRGQFEKFIKGLKKYDVIIIHSLPVLSNHVEELIKIITCFLSKKVALYIAKCGVFINKDSKIEQILPLLNDLRETEQSKEARVGRPRGSRSKSKFDRYQLEIIKMLNEGYNVSAIARALKVSRSSLKDYIQSRNVKSISKGVWVEIDKSDNSNDSDDTIIICPFEKKDNENKTKVRMQKKWKQFKVTQKIKQEDI